MTKSKKVGGTMDYPFQNEFHNYPIPGKTSFPITSDVNTNVVSNKDLYGCGIKEGMWVTNGGIVRGGAKKQQKQQTHSSTNFHNTTMYRKTKFSPPLVGGVGRIFCS